MSSELVSVFVSFSALTLLVMTGMAAGLSQLSASDVFVVEWLQYLLGRWQDQGLHSSLVSVCSSNVL